MKKTLTIIASSILVQFSCESNQFDTDKRKNDPKFKYEMTKHLISSKVLIGKTKTEIVNLLDTTDIKQPFNFNSNDWMYIIPKTNSLATSSPVVIIDVQFQNDTVTNASERK